MEGEFEQIIPKLRVSIKDNNNYLFTYLFIYLFLCFVIYRLNKLKNVEKYSDEGNLNWKPGVSMVSRLPLD